MGVFSLCLHLWKASCRKQIRGISYADNGQCVAAFAFYGYLKSPQDKHKLIIDPVAGAVVKDMFHLKIQGHSLCSIADILNERGILPPLAYKQIYLRLNQKTGFKTVGKMNGIQEFSCREKGQHRIIRSKGLFTGLKKNGSVWKTLLKHL